MNGETKAGHALVVGGTGMLRGVCLQLAREGWLVSVIARDRLRLRNLAHEFVGRISPMPLDYRDSALLSDVIRGQSSALGPISLVIAWIHSTAPDAARIVAESASATGSPVRFFHVLGSSTVDPARLQPEFPSWAAAVPTLSYSRVILGFVLERNGSRWLTSEEISDGVLRAITSGDETSIVGIIEPWSKRPH